MNFRCEKCKKAKATVHITDSYPTPRELHLCDDCASDEKVIHKTQTTSVEVLQQFMQLHAGLTQVDDRVCGGCGITFKDFQTRGLLGCPQCYHVFDEFLQAVVDQAHGGATHHIGKVPGRAGDAVRRLTGLRRLKRDLQEAILLEDYEAAAQIRDRIEGMENE